MIHAKRFVPVALIAIALLQGCGVGTNSSPAAVPPIQPPTATPTETVTLEGSEYRVSGPYTHENLAVYLFHTAVQDPREYITLDEGLKSGEVKVSEKAAEQVNELLIENTSSKYLFLHEGDRVRGGKQDRTLFSSFVIAPKSAAQPLPSFCIEHNRWTEGGSGRNFQVTANSALAPKDVRCAAKVSKDQSMVWNNVAAQKSACSIALGSPNTNSSLNETLDSPKIKEISDACAKALSTAVEKPTDAVGIAIVVNGKIEEVDVYPNHGVLLKISPRLLQSYAIQAAQEKKDSLKFQAPETKSIVAFINDGKEKDKRNEKINADNTLTVQNYDNKKAQCATVNDGRVVHWQALSGVESAVVIPQQARQQQSRSIRNDPVQHLQSENQRPANENEATPRR